MTLIYKIAFADDWLEAAKVGEFTGSSTDKEDGFIHFSTAQQLCETLKLHYSHTDRMLAISAVDADALGEGLKWEVSRNGDLFPHLYGCLPTTTVHSTLVSHYIGLADNDFETLRGFVERRGIFENS